MAAWRRRFSVRSFRSLFQRPRCPVRPLMREACCPLSFPFSKSASSDCFFSRSWLPVVLVGADSVLLLAVLGGLLHCVHDLAVLLGEGNDPERDQFSEILLVTFKYFLQGKRRMWSFRFETSGEWQEGSGKEQWREGKVFGKMQMFQLSVKC